MIVHHEIVDGRLVDVY